MEKHPHPFDDFLKEAMKGHQLVPREKARKAFLEEASTIIPASKVWNNWYYLPILVIFIAGIVAFLYRQGNNEPATTSAAHPENILAPSDPSLSSVTPPVLTSTSTTTHSSTSITGNGTITSESIIQNESKTSYSSSNIPINSKTDTLASYSVKNDTTFYLVPPILSFQNTLFDNDTPYSKTDTFGLNLDALSKSGTTISDSINNVPPPLHDTTLNLPSPDNSKTPVPALNNPKPYFTAAVYDLPEWMFNTLEDGKFVDNFGIEATFYRGNVLIRTGAGISVSKGITENAVEYNDYLGTYNKLDSITFTFSEAEHNFTPNLFMSSEKVWDSVQKFDSTDVIKRYTYLQVPLVLGFDFWQRGRFTAGVRIGTIMSVLVNSKQLSGEYNPGEDKVVGISRLTPELVSVNWQALGGINASALLAKDIYLEIEPQAKYYYQSIYEKSGYNKKPWSVGVRVAMVYKF